MEFYHAVQMLSPPFFEGREAGFERSGAGVKLCLKRYIFPLDLETRAETQLLNAGRYFFLYFFLGFAAGQVKK
jgi:hypothetical protein